MIQEHISKNTQETSDAGENLQDYSKKVFVTLLHKKHTIL